MSVTKIKNLEGLLQPHLGETKKITDVKIVRLTAPGENYGSVMLKVDLSLSEGGILSVVAKLIPELEFFQKIFNIQVSVKAEIAFYDVIVPTLQEFQRSRGDGDVVDFFPKMYGARINLNGKSDVVDGDAVILLENLKVAGYENVDRHLGFDYESTKFLLRDMARFHAVPLALRILHPETFDEKIKPNLACFNKKEKLDIPMLGDSTPPQMTGLQVLQESGRFKHIKDKLEKVMTVPPDEIDDDGVFVTISHKDMWMNNFMVKFEEGRIVDSKLLDFQNYSYDTLIKDLLFFLTSSVRLEVLKKHLDEFVEYYHEEFVKTLEILKVPNIKNSYNYITFLKEISNYAAKDLGHITFFIMLIVYGRKIDAVGDGGPPPLLTKDDILPEAKEKVFWIWEEFDRRNWINI